MNPWLEWLIVGVAVLASVAYALYALGPRRVKQSYSRLATKYFGLRAAHWFRGSVESCDNCPSNKSHGKK